ncbi:MAG: hypothetical protein JOY62_10710 [Acidobacteriaceae bacterium]|nr:hypothetical protein [Acidobacteriaceae bacterium]MBV9780430.1 hypothetical protein [Acidobacteriaceae bacterium]
MANSKNTFSTLLVASLLVGSAHAQHGILGGAGTYCSDGWKFSASYVLEPWSPGQHISIEGVTDVMHTDAKDGRPDTFHRVFVDPAAQTYWGYDVEVEPVGETGSARLRFRPFSLRADQLPKDYHPIQVPNVANFRELPPPQFPAGTFQSGQVIAIDVLKNAATGQKVVDYIEVEFEPTSVPSKAEPRDFEASDVLLHIFLPSVRVNGKDILVSVRVADRSLHSKLIWLSLPGRARFLFSLSPRAGHPFQKTGTISGSKLSFSSNGARYELSSSKQITESNGNWNLYVLAAPPGPVDPSDSGFSYGEVNTVEEFLSKLQ